MWVGCIPSLDVLKGTEIWPLQQETIGLQLLYLLFLDLQHDWLNVICNSCLSLQPAKPPPLNFGLTKASQLYEPNPQDKYLYIYMSYGFCFCGEPWLRQLQSIQILWKVHCLITIINDRYNLILTTCIGEGNGNPLQCPCLENPRDGGAWWAAVCGVAQSRTRLKRLSSSSSIANIHWMLTKF